MALSLPNAKVTQALRSLLSLAYPVYAAVCVLVLGAVMFGSMRAQLELSAARAGIGDAELQALQQASWPSAEQPLLSAPLDDTFIYFDFARSAAQLHPFEWSVGNGYSSGSTSVLYPFVLALGYAIGYHGLWLVLWAGIVACLGTWGFLLALGAAFESRLRGFRYLLPPLLLSIGALDWTLFSGMETAFLLGIWGLCFRSWMRLRAAHAAEWRGPALALGASGLLLACSRPEAVALVFIFGALGVRHFWALLSRTECLRLALLCVAPALGGVLAQGAFNLELTGEWQAAGAVAKLVLHDRRFLPWEALERIVSNALYAGQNVFFYYLGVPIWGPSFEPTEGWPVLVQRVISAAALGLAVAPLFARSTRDVALLLWLSSLVWLGIVAQNGTIDWHNDRYLMPAVSWLSASVALGLAVVASATVLAVRRLWADRFTRTATVSVTLARESVVIPWAIAGALTLVIVWGRASELQRQVWFYGRATRNIYEQQVTVGTQLKRFAGKSVLVGDAGAIPYLSDLPAVDIAGLGGYYDYPFARAARLGLASSVEVLQRLPRSARPSLIALYPSWFKELPLWFGERLFEVRARGNVICGDEHKVVYRARWEPLDDDFAPPAATDEVTAELDFADVQSERASELRLLGGEHKVEMKLLERAGREPRAVWDGGRLLAKGARIQATLRDVHSARPLRLHWRVAPSQPTTLVVRVNEQRFELELEPGDRWQEPVLTVFAANGQPAADTSTRAPVDIPISIEVEKNSIVLHHLWVVQ